MRAISIKQPWASMIISGEKPIENRTWYPNEEGPIAICSTKIPDADALEEFPGDYPNGVLVGVVDFIGIVQVDMDVVKEENLNLEEDDLPLRSNLEHIDDADLDWFDPDRTGWILRNPRPCKQVPVKGQQGIYHIPDEIIEYL